MNDSDYLDAVTNAVADCATDVAGGVSIDEVADRLEVDPESARVRLNRLADEGDLEKVQGLSADSLHPRGSYLPPNE